MSKSSQAFRTIREVADWLDVAAHVLRFWESKFPQIKPVKRAGGRRYYRPSDMELVGGIKVLLHDRGMTIRGVQMMIREEGIAAVSALSPPLSTGDDDLIEGDATAAEWVEDAAADNPSTAPEAEAGPDHDARQAGFDFEAASQAPTAPDRAPDMPAAAAAPDADHDAGAAEPPRDRSNVVPLTPAEDPVTPDGTAPDPSPERETAAPEDPAPAPAPDQPMIAERLQQLAAHAANPSGLPEAAPPWLRPALGALRDRMRSDPPA